MENSDSLGLWLLTREGWKLIDFSFGHSDAFFVIFPQKYGVPRELVNLRHDSPNEKDAQPRDDDARKKSPENLSPLYDSKWNISSGD